MNLKIGVLVSGSGSNLQSIIDKNDGEYEIVFVGSDNPQALGLDKAKKAGIDTFVVDFKSIDFEIHKTPDDWDIKDIFTKQKFKKDVGNIFTYFWKKAVFESILLKEIRSFPEIDILVLAGFMKILTPYFIDEFEKDIINIHPALLPSFPGKNGYLDTFEYGCKVGGCTVHYVDYGEDTGQIIAQKAFNITEEDTVDSVKKKGLAIEWELYPEVIKSFCKKGK